MPDPFAPLIAIAQRGLPFTASDGQAFVRLHAASPEAFYILPVRSRAYREWFFHEFFVQYDTLPTSRAFHSILNHLEAEANHNERNQRLAVWQRVGCRGGRLVPDQILLNLANPECEFVEISAAGWKTTAGAGALLQTSRSTFPLPAPAPSSAPAALETLRSCLNLSSRADWLRCLAWLLAALRPDGPFPVLILQGPPGSGKTFAARILRSLIDPSTASLTPIPSSARDLLTLARHNWILAFDHLSALSPQLSDAICRLSSGLGATLRETSGPGAEPLQQHYKRPVLLTVTERWSCPAGLARRALTVNLPPLTPRTEDSLLTVFQQAWPDILAALCSAVAAALNPMNHIDPPTRRCPDALAWAMAASPALGCTAKEMRQAFDLAEPHPMTTAVRTLLEQRRQFTGSAAQLLELLQPLVDCQTPKGLSRQLRSCMLILADNGIELKFRRLGGGARIIELRDDPCDASCEKFPPDASQISDPPTQPTETEPLTVR
jgi:putative DNA primase/helicase